MLPLDFAGTREKRRNTKLCSVWSAHWEHHLNSMYNGSANNTWTHKSGSGRIFLLFEFECGFHVPLCKPRWNKIVLAVEPLLLAVQCIDFNIFRAMESQEDKMQTRMATNVTEMSGKIRPNVDSGFDSNIIETITHSRRFYNGIMLFETWFIAFLSAQNSKTTRKKISQINIHKFISVRVRLRFVSSPLSTTAGRFIHHTYSK